MKKPKGITLKLTLEEISLIRECLQLEAIELNSMRHHRSGKLFKAMSEKMENIETTEVKLYKAEREK